MTEDEPPGGPGGPGEPDDAEIRARADPVLRTDERLSLTEVASMGVGTMIGAGIFALFGQIAVLAGGFSWLAFIAAAVISGLAGYSYLLLSRLSSTNGGLAEYLHLGWNGGRIGSVISLTYFFSICIVLGLVAKSFGNYGVQLFDLSQSWVNWFAAFAVLVFLAINATGVGRVGAVERVLVAGKLVVLIGFVVVLFINFDTGTFSSDENSGWLGAGDFINAVALANLSFAGFAVIANTGGSARGGAKTIGKAIFIAIAVTTAVYVLLDIAVFGNLSIGSIEEASSYALARAARPSLGQFGFTLLAITAVVSTSTNINANIFSAASTVSYLADEGKVSTFFARRVVGRNGTWSMLITVALVLTFLFLFDLSEIADVASLTFLLVHTFIPLGNLLHKVAETGAKRWLLMLSVAANGGVLVFFLVQLLSKGYLEPMVFVAVVAASFTIEALSSDRTGGAGEPLG